MRESIMYILAFFKNYNGHSVLWILSLLSLLFIAVKHKNLRQSFAIPITFVILVIVNPILYKYVWYKLLGDTYWRMFWGIPMVLIVSLTMIDIIRLICKKYNVNDWIRVIIVGVICVLFVFTGKFMYRDEIFTKAENAYKIPQSAINVADTLLQYDDKPTVATPTDLFIYLRQYDSNIQMLYGRNTQGYIGGIDKEVNEINDELLKENPNWSLVCSGLHKFKCDYLVVDSTVNNNYLQARQYGFMDIEHVDNYVIFHNELGNTTGEWTFTNNYEQSNGNIITVKDKNGYLSLIGGGTWKYGDSLRKIILNEGGNIQKWIVPSLSDNILDAVVNIGNTPVNIAINEYIVDEIISNASETVENMYQDASVFRYFKDYVNRNRKFTYIGSEEYTDFMGLKMEVYNAFGDNSEANNNEMLINSSLIFKLSSVNSTILYVPDVSMETIDHMINKYGNQISCDYLIIDSSNRDIKTKLQDLLHPVETYNLNEEFSFTIQ